MRILADTNILFSTLLYPNSVPATVLLKIANEQELVLCDQNLAEIREVIRKKAPQFLSALESFLAELSYELIPAVNDTTKEIRDTKDQPILNAAILNNVDIIVTGDKDFLELEMEHPKCMTASEYLENY